MNLEQALKEQTLINEQRPKQEDRVHHPYSPSTLQSLEACPCYEGRDESHIRAIAGTKMHKVTEDRMDDESLSDDDALMAAECLDFYEERKQLAVDARAHAMISELPDHRSYPEILELTETYLPIDDLEFEDEIKVGLGSILLKIQSTTAGYFDRAFFSHAGTYCEAFDWKFGVWSVEKVKNNLQAIAYVLGLFKKFPKLESVRFWIKQPAIGFLDDHVFHRSEILSLLLRVSVVVERARMARAKADFSSANPTIPNCLFCKHTGICPAVTKFACTVGNKFAPLKIPASVTPSMVQDPANTGLGMQLAQVMKVWSEAFRKVTAERVLRGAPLPEGYRLQQRDGSRAVTDMAGFKREALRYLTEEEYAQAFDVSIGAIEDSIGAKAPRGSKKHAIQEFKSCLEAANVVERGSPAVFLQAEKTKE